MTDGRTPSEEKAATSSLGELLGTVTKDVSTLMRQEIALAKAEITDSAKKAGKGAGLLGGAGYAGAMAVLFLSLALMYGLSYWFDNLAWAAVVVAVIWAVIGLVMYSRGRKQLKTVQAPARTADTLKKIPETLKRNEADR